MSEVKFKPKSFDSRVCVFSLIMLYSKRNNSLFNKMRLHRFHQMCRKSVTLQRKKILIVVFGKSLLRIINAVICQHGMTSCWRFSLRRANIWGMIKNLPRLHKSSSCYPHLVIHIGMTNIAK